jgi:excisionase family DNA binding protein
VLTVRDAARRTGRDPESIRRWIRDGRLRAKKSGTRHLIEEADLDAATEEPRMLPLPEAWGYLPSGEPMFDVVKAIDEARTGR